jgi:hypothetical protein
MSTKKKILTYFPHGGAVAYLPETDEIVFIKEGYESGRMKISDLRSFGTDPNWNRSDEP